MRLYKEGKTIDDIAKERAMAVTTIEGHLASFIPSGEVAIADFLKEDELAEIKKAMDKLATMQLGPIKSAVGDKFTFWTIEDGCCVFGCEVEIIYKTMQQSHLIFVVAKISSC